MGLLKTDKDVFTKEDILESIRIYERDEVPRLTELWEYAKGRNVHIKERKSPDNGANNPDNRIPISYGKKIVNTYTGYALRPRYTTYKASSEVGTEAQENVQEYMSQLQSIFNKNKEHLKTSKAGKNAAIFGRSYEIVYIDGEFSVEEKGISLKAVPRFFSVDPRELILFYDFSSEPKKKIGIRFYLVADNLYKVEIYYKDKTELWERYRDDESNEWKLRFIDSSPHFFEEVPIAAYYFGDDHVGILESVLPLIDAYDVLISDSMNEFDRFAYAYLVMKKFGLTDQTKKKDSSSFSQALRFLKFFRVFEWVPADADIKFLTKDIPTDFLRFMSDFLKEQIHIQSHVPDFTNREMSAMSGIAIQRLLFDFENVVSSAEAEFDVGLDERMSLITEILLKINKGKNWNTEMIIISHKRNLPLDLKQFAEVAEIMKRAGFSKYLCADIMPDDVIPNVEEELERQRKEAEEEIPDIYTNPKEEEEDEEIEDEEREEE